ncbi:MAG: hypothetical protein JWN44_3101 [Myxococcales bacterium]|nr:hypothetical protein [Myxococcales bacterium]
MSAGVADAGGTRTWRLTSYKDFEEGEATGVLLSSLGEATSGFTATRVDVNESVVYATAVAPDGTVYVGTGDQGTVYTWRGGKLKKLAKLDAVLVSSLAAGPAGTVFAGTMPGGRVFAIDKDGKVREVAKLDAEHVWSLIFDEAKQTLYAATGPTGKLFGIDVSRLDRPAVGRRDKLLAETGEKHLLSLVRGDEGALYAGSADQAILYKIVPNPNGSGNATISALHDFEGDELRAIARRGNTLYVAVNEFQRSGAAAPSSSGGPLAPRGTKIVTPPTTSTTTTPAATSTRDRKGRGAIYRVDPDGRVEQLHALGDGYFTALSTDGDGNVWAAAGSNGRVYLIRPDRTVITAFDLPERQVLTLAFDPNVKGGPSGLLGTGDAGALYRVSADPPKDAHYVSKVFDAQFPARWGSLRWGGRGPLALETRSGNTSHPDKTWSAWSSPQKPEKQAEGGAGRVLSPAARYFQLRATFGGAKSILRDVTVYYQPQNQRQRVTEIVVGDENAARRVSAVARSSKPRSPVVKVRWRADNPDDDDLIYRLYYREESETNWKPIGGNEPLTRTDFEWNTESIPDGNYVIKVISSDERSNPREEALEASLTSTPFLVDNRKPELADVKVAYPMASGAAHDSFSPISELAYSIDGGDWQPIAPKDGIFDDPHEEFSVKLPSGLAAGAHSLAVRAVDAADNVGAVQLTFRVK